MVKDTLDWEYGAALAKRLIDAMLDSDMFSPAERDQLMDYRTWDCVDVLLEDMLYLCTQHRVHLPKGLWDELHADAVEYGIEESLGYLEAIKSFSAPAK